jgi:hypothetical protein
MVTRTDLSKYDFAFPAGAPQGQAIKSSKGARATYVPFFTPMAIATFQPIVDILSAPSVGVVTRDAGDGHLVFNVAKYLQLVQARKRWSDLAPGSAYNVNRTVLISSTDFRTSNSAAMYLSMASYVANGDNIVSSAADADKVAAETSSLFLEQGFIASSSEEPFNDYLSIGIGKEPMVMVYEAQFRGAQIAHNPDLTSDRVLMYPSPTVFSKHTFVPLNANGDAVGQLLLGDPTLQQLAVRYGFRTSDGAYMQSFAQQQKLSALPTLVDVIDPPTFDILERLITTISNAYAAGSQGGTTT